jgi:hypothetical protein
MSGVAQLWWQSGRNSAYAPWSGVTEYVNRAQLSMPSGWEALKGFFGQRICGG